MANTQTPAGRLKRTLWWFGRHKVTAVFTVLLLALLMWLFGSWIVWNVQVNSERRRYLGADRVLGNFKNEIEKTGPSHFSHYHECSYTGNGSIFAIKYLGCNVTTQAIYDNLSKQDATIKVDQTKDLIHRDYITVKNQGNYDPNDLAVNSFSLYKIRCFYDASYYDRAASRYKWPEEISSDDKTVLFIEISCGGSAKAEYFPVVKD